MTSTGLSALCLTFLLGPVVCSSGLEFTLAPTDRNVAVTSDSCGVLLCKTSSVSDDKERNITSLSLYKVVSQGTTGSYSSKPGNLSSLAFVSTSQPSFEQFSNGVKVSGSLKSGKASLRVELSKQTDCLAEYTCELHKVDSEGKELITSYRLLQAQDQSNRNELNKDRTASLNARIFSLVLGLDTKLTTNEMYLKDKLSFLEDQTLDLQKQITNKIHKKLALMESSTERLEVKVDTKLNLIESRVSSVESSLETKVARIQNQLTDKIYSLKYRLQNKASTNFKDIEDKLCDLETKLASVDSEYIQQNVLSTVKDQVDEQFTKVKKNTKKADHTLRAAANVLTGLKRDNTKFQANLTKTYRNLVYDVSSGMDEVFLQSENLTTTVENSLRYIRHSLLLSLGRVESTANSSVTKTFTSLQTLEAKLNSAIDDEIESALVDLFMPETCKKNTPVQPKTPSTPYPVIYKSDIVGLNTPFLCDTLTDNGGWIVIQRRSTGDVDFYRDWVTYKKGFGALHTDFWLGLENIHTITNSGQYELRVDLEYQGQSKYAVYGRFSLAGENENYKLTVESYSGTAGDSLSLHNDMEFSTRDRDNDKSDTGSCARRYKGAWWYKFCYNSNLNGLWQVVGVTGPRWKLFTGTNPASFTEMKIRRLED
ncbi:fibrinogen-related protein 2 [Elysia marginata]|uniref:Fibrinogen-related protein 2 n=1 Tax=Elysia marginata TaxID=1093978 RepID=A0AAV4GU34_9GAST|nr:fibrinogen-related protein 2 [Elysia marginata]